MMKNKGLYSSFNHEFTVVSGEKITSGFFSIFFSCSYWNYSSKRFLLSLKMSNIDLDVVPHLRIKSGKVSSAVS